MNIRIPQREKEIKQYLLEIESLKNKIKELEDTIRELKTKNAEVHRRNISLIEIEHINERLYQDKKSLKNNIVDLQNEIIKTIKEKDVAYRINQAKLENEIIYYKGLRDTGLGKIEAADKIIKLNEIQHCYILKIEKELEDLKNENDIKMRQLKIEHEQNYKKLKKKMIDFIKKSQKEMEKSNASNIELYSKFSLLYKNQMLDELENQNKQILDLIKEKERQDKKIFALTEEVLIHDSVEKILKKKNFNYQKIINNFIELKNKESKNIHKNLQKENNKNSITNENEYSQKKRIYLSEKKNKENDLKKNYDYDNFENGIFKTVMSRKNFLDYISLEKEYKELLKNNKLLKDQINTLKDKDRLFQKKYTGIINIYKIALDDLMKDEEVIEKKIYINLDKINEGDYDSYTKEEKMKILQLLIKHLLPLIKINNSEISKLRKTFTNFDIKMTSTLFSKFSENSRNLTSYKPYTNYRNITEDSNYLVNKEKKFMPIFDNNINNKFNSIFKNDDSNSFKSSFWGVNFNNNNLIKNKDDNSNANKTNGFLYSASSFYKNKKPKKKVKEIKINKRGIFGEDLQYKKSPLLRYMYIQNMKSENKRNDMKNCLTDKNFSS